MTPVISRGLLICKDYRGRGLSGSLAQRGWECEFAPSVEAACRMFEVEEFDLVLSEIRLPPASANPLIRLIAESNGSLFLSQGVEASCWWLPVLRRGQLCWGAPALRPSELARELDELREEVLQRPLETPMVSYRGDGRRPCSLPRGVPGRD